MSITGGLAALLQSIKNEAPLPTEPSAVLEYHSFQKFPRDIQLMIWDFAVAEIACTRRVLEITYKANRKKRDGQARLFKPSPLLHACHDSRKLASKVYQVTDFGGQLPHKMYFNPTMDTLYFLTIHLLTQFLDKVPENTRGYMDISDGKELSDSSDDILELRNRHPNKINPPPLQCIRQIAIGTLDCDGTRMSHELLYLLQAVARLRGLKSLNIVKPTTRSFPRYSRSEAETQQKQIAYEKIKRHDGIVQLYNRLIVHVAELDSPLFLTGGFFLRKLMEEEGWVHPEVTQLTLKEMGECQF